MLLQYIKLKMMLGDKISYDRWISLGGRNFLVHYNYYEKCMEIKDESYNVLQSFFIRPLMFRYDRQLMSVLKTAVNCSKI